ncbi:glycosyltransferase 87 family protein [Corynebacterium striatum]|uniref:glycosyltransferase family 87 protein n=1 Tax=Corynebacterium striatum TaxID=43770 RepID=UPI00254BFDB3|nr:glycosyltransferase 87 family protein [Corynebacterium striatum]MDK8813400.1 glycosyltransferase 87 family protein [Corynebacterium striatum]
MRGASAEGRIPLNREPFAHDIIEFFGGPRGRFARTLPSRWMSPLRAIIGVSWIFLALGFLSKANCAGSRTGEDGVISLNWDGNRQYTSFCYNDIIPLYGGRGLDQGGFPYAYSWQEGDLTRYMEYPVLAGMFQGLMGWVSRVTYPIGEFFGVADAGWYFGVTALVLSCIWIGTVYMVFQLTGNRAWDTMLMAASPLVIIHAFTNWDIPSIAFMVGALFAVTRGKNWLAGILIGLGTAFKLWPLFILGAFFVLAARNKRWAPFGAMFSGTVISWLVVNVPVALKYPDAWREFFRLNEERGAEWTTIYALIDRYAENGLTPEFLNSFTLPAFLLGCAAIGIFGLRARREPRVAELIYLIVMAFLLINKVWSPQYSIWLVVPALLALPRWRLLLSWMLVDAMVWPVLMWHMLGTENKGIDHELLDLFVIGRDTFIVIIGILIIRQMLGKSVDKVRAAHGGRDPLAGDFV